MLTFFIIGYPVSFIPLKTTNKIEGSESKLKLFFSCNSYSDLKVCFFFLLYFKMSINFFMQYFSRTVTRASVLMATNIHSIAGRLTRDGMPVKFPGIMNISSPVLPASPNLW